MKKDDNDMDFDQNVGPSSRATPDAFAQPGQYLDSQPASDMSADADQIEI
jgi:hypothetical protein